MCFTKPVESITSSVRSPKSQKSTRKVEDGWTARGLGIWTDEEFSSSDDDIDAAPTKPVQKKPHLAIRMERAESALKRSVTGKETPFIVRKRRSSIVSKGEVPAVNIVQKKRAVVQQTPVVVKKVRDIIQSCASNASTKPATSANIRA